MNIDYQKFKDVVTCFLIYNKEISKFTQIYDKVVHTYHEKQNHIFDARNKEMLEGEEETKVFGAHST